MRGLITMTKLLKTNRSNEELQPKNKMSMADLKSHKQDSNLKITRESRDFLVAMSLLKKAKNQKDAVKVLIQNYYNNLSDADKKLFDMQMQIINSK